MSEIHPIPALVESLFNGGQPYGLFLSNSRAWENRRRPYETWYFLYLIANDFSSLNNFSPPLHYRLTNYKIIK